MNMRCGLAISQSALWRACVTYQACLAYPHLRKDVAAYAWKNDIEIDPIIPYANMQDLIGPHEARH